MGLVAEGSTGLMGICGQVRCLRSIEECKYRGCRTVIWRVRQMILPDFWIVVLTARMFAVFCWCSSHHDGIPQRMPWDCRRVLPPLAE